jgi:superoxide dismutase
MGEGITHRHRYQVAPILCRCPDTKIYNNAAQHWNHTFYWYCITPQKTEPSPQLRALI